MQKDLGTSSESTDEKPDTTSRQSSSSSSGMIPTTWESMESTSTRGSSDLALPIEWIVVISVGGFVAVGGGLLFGYFYCFKKAAKVTPGSETLQMI